ncbi:SMP-30/gluconolactonase/LRE family protein [Pedobacter sp. JY14-1]|uniref:SMP-30/gluconolactonase/LRE family protein n=1 Tax=Pedobacter sp. JY14-1 TaxID=3034151 RepID=UPI0023E227C9|nr:SMP-30/gluconolactonase/LRE family protein [Pedobacter sp. JY14-1]
MASILYSSHCILGEAPVWHQERESCFWADIETGILYEYVFKNKDVNIFQPGHKVSLIIPSGKEELILGMQGGVARYRLSDGHLSWISQLDTDWTSFRCNDGGADIHGRIWVSTTELDHKPGAGSIFCLDRESGLRTQVTDISIPNGIVWSPDNRKIYYTDSVKNEVYALDTDPLTGNIISRDTVIQIPDEKGLPDGMAVDSEGFIWIALWNGYGLGRFSPENGKMNDFIAIPAPNVTSCCFVGSDLNQLVITTARKGMSAEMLAMYPESGNIFITETKIKGIPTYKASI